MIQPWEVLEGYPIPFKRPRKLKEWYSPLEEYKKAMRHDPCCYCGRVRAGTIDHIIPRLHGGANGPSNWTGACKKCNEDKGVLSLLDFL